MWVKNGGQPGREKKTPSQSTISRLLGSFSEETFSRLVYSDERKQISAEWDLYLKRSKEEVINRRKKKKARKRKTKPMPQYCFDGKARKGCKSAQTGRDELDVTMYCPETNQILDKRTLDDKEGERAAVVEIFSGMKDNLPIGVVSGDAGIVCPAVTSAIITAGHGYVLQIKGNAGAAYQEAGELPWDRVIVAHEEHSKAHGRVEFRRIKALAEEFADLSEFDKYTNIGVVIQVERSSRYLKAGKVTKETEETSYYIGDKVFASLGLEMQGRYIRDHWGQESYHWVKDKIMNEDDSMQRQPNGSRALGVFRSQVSKFGRAICNSTKRFIDHFNAEPNKMALAL
jgi:hypothetical protein